MANLLLVLILIPLLSFSFTDVDITITKDGLGGSITTRTPLQAANIGSGCSCDLQVYDYCEGASLSKTRNFYDDSIISTITYTFSESVYCGVFGNGYDMWAAPKTSGGVLTVSGITPDSTGSGSSLRNGMITNPLISTAGIDGRFSDANEVLPLVIPTTINSITSIIKGDSWNDAGSCTATVDGKTRMCFEHIDVLTVLHDVPFGYGRLHFRPPFYGQVKSLRYRDSVNLGLLPAIAKQQMPNGDNIDMESAIVDDIEWMDGIKMDWGNGYDHTESLKGYVNFNTSTGYSPNGWGTFARRSQWLYLDPASFGFTQSQKDELALRIVEHGFDMLQIIKYYPDGGGPTVADGGHGAGRYFPTIVAAVLANDGGALLGDLNARLSTDLGKQSFAATSQIWYGADPAYPVYGGKSVSGGRQYQTCLEKTNSIMLDPLGLVDNADVRYMDDPNFATEDCDLGYGANYMGIFGPPEFAGSTICHFIPACKANASEKWLIWTRRMMLTGAVGYANGLNSGTIDSKEVLPYCDGGPNDGFRAFVNGDCPSGSLANNLSSYPSGSKGSHFALKMFYKMQSCLNTSTCMGQ